MTPTDKQLTYLESSFRKDPDLEEFKDKDIRNIKVLMTKGQVSELINSIYDGDYDSVKKTLRNII
jgi:hypothetical protein